MLTKQQSHRSHYKLSIMLLVFSTTALSADAQNYSLTNQGYTAQRKPRVAVMEFEDTNTYATNARYGPSVSAMLVTFLKTKSQFVVVERQNIDMVLDEWKNNQNGLTNLTLDETQSELLEKIDVILMGNVTLVRDGIEVDAKLLSRTDGRIITAAQRNGPIACLRQVVDRVGVAIENGFLKPYYGSLRLSLDTPENTRIFLTPILSERALDEEKPPVELGFTIHPGEDKDKVHHWVTHPATYTIENILSGWYSFRLERPGYESRDIANALFEVRQHHGKSNVYNLLERKTISAPKAMGVWQPGRAQWEKYLVQVAPLQPNEVDATARIITLRKKNGNVRFTVLDENARPISGARISLVSRDLELNRRSLGSVTTSNMESPASPENTKTAESPEPSTQTDLSASVQGLRDVDDAEPSRTLSDNGERSACEFWIDEEITFIDHGRRLVRANDIFDLQKFEGGLVAIEDYLGQSVPTGTYEVFVWAPYYKLRSVTVRVDDGTEPQNVTLHLARKEQPLLLRGRSENMISFVGQTTGYQKSVPLDVASGEKLVSLPVDEYRVDTDVIGFRSWLQGLNLLPSNEAPPSLEELLPTDAAEQLATQEVPEPRELRIKNSVWVAGRFANFRRHPGAFYDRRTSDLLDRILGDPANYDWRFELEDEEDDRLAELEERLRDVDLLILSEADMGFIRVLPKVEAIVRRFVESGRALLAFVTWEGDYESIVGAPLSIRKRSSTSSKLKLQPGEVDQFEIRFKVDLGATRALPKPRHLQSTISGWNVVSYTKKGKRPRVIERGSLDRGGYVMVWFEHSDLSTGPLNFNAGGFLARLGGLFGAGNAQKVPLVESDSETQISESDGLDGRVSKIPDRNLDVSLKALVKAREANRDILLAKSMLKNRALLWAEYLMYREFDTAGDNLRAARQRLLSAGVRQAEASSGGDQGEISSR